MKDKLGRHSFARAARLAALLLLGLAPAAVAGEILWQHDTGG